MEDPFVFCGVGLVRGLGVLGWLCVRCDKGWVLAMVSNLLNRAHGAVGLHALRGKLLLNV